MTHPYNKRDSVIVIVEDSWKSYFIIICIAAILLTLLPCQHVMASAGIISVQSSEIKPFNDSLKGFKSACKCDIKRFVLSDTNEKDILATIRNTQPDLVLAIGIDALNKVKSIKSIPIIYLMVLNPQSVISGFDNITGLSMMISPEEQLSIIKQYLPHIKRIGVLYDPFRTSNFIMKAQTASESAGIELIAREVLNTKDVPEKMKNMEKEVDLFWMLPDVTVFNPETVEFLLLSSIENRIPVVTFSDKYLKIGAFMSLMIDASDIGKQAWEITEKVLAGTEIKKIDKAFARNPVVTINRNIVNKLGISISDKFIDDKDN